MAEGVLAGKVALITGGSSGIGLATVRRFTSEGATVAIVDMQPPPAGAGDFYVEADVGDPDAWPSIIEKIEVQFEGIDVGYLNAGVTTGESSIADLTDEQYRRIMRVNVDGVVYGVRALIPVLKQRGGGQVVCTASLAGLTPFPTDPIYTLTKHAVVGLVRALGPVLEHDGITINAVNPGIVDTPLVGDGREALVAAGFPLLQPEEIANAVVLAVTSGRSGECWACQPGRDPVVYRFAGIPGPRTPGAEGMAPPLS
jgi:NAD(P)-dependent dehydrogenase (short-subunit alcohol dehydrogenase family)